MTFLWSGLLVLLLLLPVAVVAYLLALRRRRPSAVRYSSLELVRAAMPRPSRLRRHLPFAAFVAALGSLVLALARPVVILAVPTDRTTIVLTIDVSGSMCSTDIAPTRLQAAEQAASRFIDGKAASAQIGIVAFSGFAEIVQPPTTDRQQLQDAVASLAVGRRTAIGDGILGAIDAISGVDPSVAKSQADGTAGPPAVPSGAYAPDIVVLLTDGASNTGTPPLDAAQQAADRGVRVYTIGYGTASGGPLDPACATQFLGREPGGGFGGGFGGGGGFGPGAGAGGFRRGIDDQTLEQIASMTGGKYYPAQSSDQLESVFSSLPLNLISKHETTDVSVAFVGLAGLLSAASLLLGRAWRPGP